MRRLVFPKLQRWIENPGRKPILLRGARQVGKTWIARELGKLFPDFIEVNFELYPEAGKIFHRDLDPNRIVRDLSLLLGRRIEAGRSLLFFDEIQEEPRAVQALRYFYEMMPEQHVIAAGSLLDFELEKTGLPVGRVTSVYIHPMSFLEFLAARNESLLMELILEQEVTTPVSDPIHSKLLHLLGEYMAVGGMPEAVARWCSTRDQQACTEVLHTVADTYRQDFNKYARKYQIKYVALLFDVIPAQMGRGFRFHRVPGNYRRRELQPALELLLKAGLVHRIVHSAGQGVPLGALAKPDVYKLIFVDIALAQAILGLDAASWLLDPVTSFINKGEITEAFVGQEILAYSPCYREPRLFFWQRQARGSHAEIDYLLQRDHQVIPVEVKSGAPGRLKSLRLFLDEHKNSPYGIRFSTLNYAIDEQLLSLPLYAVAKIMNLNPELTRYLS